MKSVLFFLICILIISCSPKHKIPDEILDPNRMQAVLWDMLRTDQFVSNYGRRDSTSSMKDKSTRLYTEVFKINKTTKSQFEKSIDFYNLHPDLFKIVLDSLEKKKNQLIHQQPYHPIAHPVAADSLRRKIVADSMRERIKSPAIHRPPVIHH